MRKKIGIICASDTELEPFIEQMEKADSVEHAMLKFYDGILQGMPVVVAYSGVCKVNAAIATQLLITLFQVEIIVNAGVAGGMEESITLFDTIIAEQSVYHDVTEDILTEFHPWMASNYFRSDSELLVAAKEYSASVETPIFFGTMATGEQFIKAEKREEINQKFRPLSVDMETASVAHTCYVNQIPFLAVRSITDTATHLGVENFEKNCEIASKRAAEVTIGLLKKWRLNRE